MQHGVAKTCVRDVIDWKVEGGQIVPGLTEGYDSDIDDLPKYECTECGNIWPGRLLPLLAPDKWEKSVDIRVIIMAHHDNHLVITPLWVRATALQLSQGAHATMALERMALFSPDVYVRDVKLYDEIHSPDSVINSYDWNKVEYATQLGNEVARRVRAANISDWSIEVDGDIVHLQIDNSGFVIESVEVLERVLVCYKPKIKDFRVSQ